MERTPHLRSLAIARTVAAATLLVSAFVVDLLFAPGRSLDRLYGLAALVFGTILCYGVLHRWLGRYRAFAAVQVAGDTLVVAAFVLASGGALSPVSFLFALPIIVAAALWGRRGGVLAASGAWCVYGLILVRDLYRMGPEELPPGRVLYAAISHLLGLLLLGVLGGMLADRLRAARAELDESRGDLQALRAEHAVIVESMATGLLTTDEQGGIAFVNRAGLDVLSEPLTGLKGRPALELFGLAPEFLAEALAMHRLGRRCRFERNWTRYDGARLFLGFAVVPLRVDAGRPGGWLIVFTDLTEIASLEAQVRTRERMAALGEMAAGMAHELRNPLAAISGCVQMLAGTASENQKTMADLALRETDRLNRTIKDFLAFARPGPFRPKPVDVLALIEEMARLSRKSADFKPTHRIDVVAGPGARPAMADPDRLRQVYWNLAGNALKAMPDGGVLRIEVAGYGGDHVQLSFRDEGEGMDEETQARLFQPFHGRFREGSGLGGAIVYRIAEEHGGRVQVVSHPNHGTEIRIIVPAARVVPDGVVTAGALREAGVEDGTPWR